MMRVKIEESSCLNPEKALNLEWLETNGLGGYASSTILNCNTRKYHGLLVANLDKPRGRHVLLSRIEDSVVVKGQESCLSCCQYPGAFVPEGRHFLTSFQLNECPRFVYETDHVRIHKAVMMVQGEDCVLVRYDVERCPAPGILILKPFMAYRGYHALSRQNPNLRVETRGIRNGFVMEPYDGMPPICIQTNVKSHFSPSPVWYNHFEYEMERERGYDWREDLFRPGIFEIPVKTGSTVIVSASLSICQGQLKRKWEAEAARRTYEIREVENIAEGYEHEEDRIHVRDLIISGRQFLIKTPSGRPTIIAGYHWFTDWGRDTLVSLPGLTFCSGRPKEGIAILASIGKHEKEGLLPNFFSDHVEENAYNTVDTSLLYFWAVQQMLKYTGEAEVIKNEIWPVLKRILRRYMEGTLFNIHMGKNGLLHAGDEKTHLTWMDATVNGKPVTPRWGYAVEINALWFNAVCFAGELARRFNESEFLFHDLAHEIKKSFVDTFWIGDDDYLGDVYCNGSLDRSVRPNQILAVSLPYSPLHADQWPGVVNKVRRELLTPFGLRTISPEDGKYEGRYGGDGSTRDMAYHQGTVWPWLLAQFGEAYLRVAKDRAAARTFLIDYLRSFIRQHIPVAGIGCISEIFDGDPPHRPNGCIAQAWSSAGLIRLYSLLNEKV
ncbi:MAG: amylo-alpha-1,6-glucosidase [Deltaproteobacteria bacterium]